MADGIKPTQPTMPGPMVSPPPEDKRRRRKKPQQERPRQTEDQPYQSDEGKGGKIDEYV
jgi:hypothetical protein